MRRSLAVAVLLVSSSSPLGAALQQGNAAVYEITLDATWSMETHPGNYAVGAHFSKLVGASHSGACVLWEPGGLATPGVESMAEEGETPLLEAEIDAAIQAGTAGELALGASTLVHSPGVTRTRVTVTEAHPFVSLVSMIGPSPDGFVGVDRLDLRDANDLWRDDVVVHLYPYDAGTDDGLGFIWPNEDTQPQEPIALMSAGPLPADVSLGTFTFTRVTSVQRYGCGLNPAGSLSIEAGLPTPGETVELALHDPNATLEAPALPLLVFTLAPAPSFPCGTQVPGFGLSAPGSPGEFLLGLPLATTLTGPAWSGAPTPITVPIPLHTAPNTKVYAQGFFVDATGQVGATAGIELLIGE